MQASIVATCISDNKGARKRPVAEIVLQKGSGVVGDGHAGPGRRQISLLARESIAKMQQLGLGVDCGDFAENLTTEGLDLPSLPTGTRLQSGETLLEVTQPGKECHARCAIYHQAGDCVMPKEGIFARVLTGGTLRPGDTIEICAAGEGQG